MKPALALQQLARRIDERDRRERALIAVTIAVVVLVIWNAVVRAPLVERHATAVDAAGQLERDIASLRDSRARLTEQIAELTGESGRSAVDRVRERLDALDETLARRTAGLISPDQMVSALRDVVSADADVSLVRLRNAGATPVITERGGAGSNGSGATGNGTADIPRVYRHDVELVVQGRYLKLLAYMKRLEGLDWQFQWDAITVETRDYPVVRATVSLSTLSLAEDWIGV